MFARATTIHAHPSFLDEGITHVRSVVMPTLADMDGCAGMSMLVDRDAGRCIVTSSWLDDDTLRASEAYAEAAFLNGRPEQALIQLQAMKKRPDLDYVGRARVDARIESITPTVLEMRRQGIDDPELERR